MLIVWICFTAKVCLLCVLQLYYYLHNLIIITSLLADVIQYIIKYV
jgi:hypothetical protein